MSTCLYLYYVWIKVIVYQDVTYFDFKLFMFFQHLETVNKYFQLKLLHRIHQLG